MTPEQQDFAEALADSIAGRCEHHGHVNANCDWCLIYYYDAPQWPDYPKDEEPHDQV